MSRLGSGPRLVGRILLGVRISDSFQKKKFPPTAAKVGHGIAQGGAVDLHFVTTSVTALQL